MLVSYGFEKYLYNFQEKFQLNDAYMLCGVTIK